MIKSKENTLIANEVEYDFSDFVTIRPSSTKEKFVVSILENGTFAMNSFLLSSLQNHTGEIKLKKDCSQLLILKYGSHKVDFGKNGRIKLYDVVEKIKGIKLSFPVYFVGDWDDTNEVWFGNLTTKNPNRVVKTNDTKKATSGS